MNEKSKPFFYSIDVAAADYFRGAKVFFTASVRDGNNDILGGNEYHQIVIYEIYLEGAGDHANCKEILVYVHMFNGIASSSFKIPTHKFTPLFLNFY